MHDKKALLVAALASGIIAFCLGALVLTAEGCAQAPAKGKDGQPCQVESEGRGFVIRCPGSPPTEIQDGQQGPKGDTGAQGIPGVDSEGVTALQLCPGTQTYTHPFESALCLSNKLYAVYWSGSQAFLSYLPPGTYVTTTNGTNCAFTVVQGCEVTH